MNSKERVLAAISGHEPDRVPIDVWYTPEMRSKMVEQLQIEEKDLLDDELSPDPLQLDLGNDLLITTVGPAASYYLSEEDYYEDEWGIGWRKVHYDKGSYTEPHHHPLADLEDPEEITIPDFSEDPRYKEARHFVNNYGDSHAIVGEISCTIFELSWYLRGFSQVLQDFHINRDFLHAYFNKLKEWARTAGRKLVETGVDIIFMGDDVGSQDQMLISPETFREFLKPIYAELFDTFRAINPDVKIAFHTDGNVMPVVEDYIEIGVDILNPIQPECMDPVEIKEEFGDKLVLHGAVSLQETLPLGTPREVEKEVKYLIKKCNTNGGFIIGPSNALFKEIPMENIITLYNSVY